jgi:hypothetical protein
MKLKVQGFEKALATGDFVTADLSAISKDTSAITDKKVAALSKDKYWLYGCSIEKITEKVAKSGLPSLSTPDPNGKGPGALNSSNGEGANRLSNDNEDVNADVIEEATTAITNATTANTTASAKSSSSSGKDSHSDSAGLKLREGSHEMREGTHETELIPREPGPGVGLLKEFLEKNYPGISPVKI